MEKIINEEERMRVCKRIAELRKELGLSQAQLAAQCGIRQEHIARIESGRHSAGLDTLIQIATALGAKIDLIINE